jgi:hypothetical protein
MNGWVGNAHINHSMSFQGVQLEFEHRTFGAPVFMLLCANLEPG